MIVKISTVPSCVSDIDELLVDENCIEVSRNENSAMTGVLTQI